MNLLDLAEMEQEVDELQIDLTNGRIYHPAYPNLEQDVLEALNELNQQERYDAAIARAQIGEENMVVGKRRDLPFGRLVAQIDQQDYHDQEALEPGCWSSESFIKDFVKAMPECGVKSGSAKIKVGYTGGAGGE